MRSQIKLLYLIVPALTFAVTPFVVVNNQLNLLSLPLLIVGLVGVVISWKPVRTAVGTRMGLPKCGPRNRSIVPKWLNEGLAVFVAGQMQPGARRQVAQQVAFGKRYSLEEINDIFTGLKSLADVGPGYELSGSISKPMAAR